MTKDEMVGWHQNFPQFEEALGVGDGQRGLVCCSPRGCKKLDTTEQQEQSIVNICLMHVKHVGNVLQA